MGEFDLLATLPVPSAHGPARRASEGLLKLALSVAGFRAASADADTSGEVAREEAPDGPHPFTVAVDLDGTLAEKQEPFDPRSIGEPRERAAAWLDAFRRAGARIIIFTVRGNDALVRAWLDTHEVPFDYINENPDQPEGASGKVLADVYLDDRGVDARDLDAGAAEVLMRIEDRADA